MNDEVHVFAGRFSSREEAAKYCQEQWEPEPDASVSDQDYTAWENRNPSWTLQDDLGVFLDSDFIELVDSADRYAYLEQLLSDRPLISCIKEKAPPEANALLLIFKAALGGFDVQLRSTPRLTYCGSYGCKA